VILGLHSWPVPLQALALVVNSRLGLRHISFNVVMGIPFPSCNVSIGLFYIH